VAGGVRGALRARAGKNLWTLNQRPTPKQKMMCFASGGLRWTYAGQLRIFQAFVYMPMQSTVQRELRGPLECGRQGQLPGRLAL
jgi:hypothetical protein